MKELLWMMLASVLMNIYFLIDTILGAILPLSVYSRAWGLYDWVYRAAESVSPFDIPPIYEGIHGTDT